MIISKYFKASKLKMSQRHNGDNDDTVVFDAEQMKRYKHIIEFIIICLTNSCFFWIIQVIIQLSCVQQEKCNFLGVFYNDI